MSRPRLVVADNHPQMSAALRDLLEPAYDVVAVVADGRAALEAAEQYEPDGIVLDIAMPGMNGLEVAQRLRKSRPGVRIIFVTVHSDQAYVAEAFRLGAQGFVVKRALVTELPTAIAEILRGGSYRSPSIAG
ncbi:MAG: response regulator transcription factor [Acidobacteriaceae bacterium]|nr:response regulator transcription factor [Acidobacteriaceae bacterium]